MKRLLQSVLAGFLLIPVLASAAGRIGIVAAESCYGDIAQQIGGSRVEVRSILDNPVANPHLFEVTPSVARAVARARIVIYNGIGYDPWMPKLLDAARNPQRVTIDVGALAGRHPGDNPHIWYDTAAMDMVAARLATVLGTADPAHRSGYRHRLVRFERSMQAVRRQIAAIRHRYTGTPVAATEPVFGYMLSALGMQVHDQSFQLAVMNGTEPGAASIAAFENNLRDRRVRLLVYNAQVSQALTGRMRHLARESGIPVVAVTESEPSGETYQQWIMRELSAVSHALAGGRP